METVIARVNARTDTGEPRIILVDDRAFVAATHARKSDAEIVLIRTILGLGEIHDVVIAVEALRKRVTSMEDAVKELMQHRVGELPRGWLRDTDASRDVLQRLAELVK